MKYYHFHINLDFKSVQALCDKGDKYHCYVAGGEKSVKKISSSAPTGDRTHDPKIIKKHTVTRLTGPDSYIVYTLCIPIYIFTHH